MKDWTDEITLRAPEPEDLDMMLAFENDAELWAEGTATGPYSRFQLKTYLSEAQNDVFVDRQLRFMIVHHDRGTLGMVDLCTFDPRHNRAEVGIMVCKEMRGQGVGRKAPIPSACCRNSILRVTRRFESGGYGRACNNFS